jgi:uncharacterized protein
MGVAVNLLAGLLFSLGLIVSGMVNPAKVLNFLDLFGSFDPSLAFVMLAAVAVTFVGYRLVLRRPRPMLADRFRLPLAQSIDGHVIIGPAIFGLGWGLSGFCPGPAVASLPLLAYGTLVFVPAMLAGMMVGRMATQRGWHAKGTAAPAAGEGQRL